MQIKNRQQLLTFITLTAVALLAIDRIVVPPLLKMFHDRADRIKQLQANVKEGALLMNGKDSIRGLWTRMQASTLTNDSTEAEQQLFNGLNKWQQLSGISINNVTPQWKQGADATYKTLECRVEAVGSLDHLSEFLYDVEKDPMALKLQSIELTSRDNDGTSIGMGVQISGLVLTSKDQAK